MMCSCLDKPSSNSGHDPEYDKELICMRIQRHQQAFKAPTYQVSSTQIASGFPLLLCVSQGWALSPLLAKVQPLTRRGLSTITPLLVSSGAWCVTPCSSTALVVRCLLFCSIPSSLWPPVSDCGTTWCCCKVANGSVSCLLD